TTTLKSVFQAFTKAIQCEPQVVLQDADLAMTEAAHVVHPYAHACRCRWHISQN
ncbi:unnamed protein product, partial [Discosporangium mesarthrocarpum]